MKVELTGRELSDVVAKARALRVQSVALRATEGRLCVDYATETLRILDVLPLFVTEAGEASVSFTALSNAAVACGHAERVVVESVLDGARLRFSGGRARTETTASFVMREPFALPDGDTVELDGEKFRSALAQVASFRSPEAYTSIYDVLVALDGDKLAITATNRHALAYATREARHETPRVLTLPGQLVELLLRTDADKLRLLPSAHHCTALVGNLTAHALRQVGSFPAVSSVVCASTPERFALISRAELLHACVAVGVASRRAHIAFVDSEVHLRAEGDHGASAAVVPFVGSVEPLEHGIDLTYLADALRSFGACDAVAFSHGGRGGPFRVEPAGVSAGFALIMPVVLS